MTRSDGRGGFDTSIDLFDETLREGAERAPISATIEAKCALAGAIASAGIRTLVVGMFPDVPHNIALLDALLEEQRHGSIPKSVRFVVISHLGLRLTQSLAALDGLGRDLSSVWLLAIHSVSDEQIRHLYPTVREKDGETFDQAAWEAVTDRERRVANLAWYQEQLAQLRPVDRLGGLIAGLLDAFRADPDHVQDAVEVVRDAGIRQVRLVDTAGTCTPEQARTFVGRLVTAFPDTGFFGHFHDDFGMATANAVVGLGAGLRGVDVSIGGFANRAGHPAMAEVVMALRQLHDVELPGFRTEDLYGLSRLAERTYGLLENPAAPVTGLVTHAVQSGIRTDLLNRSPRIFDDLDPADVGSREIRMFGVRSGQDGMARILREHEAELAGSGIEITDTTAERLYDQLVTEWEARSARAREHLLTAIDAYRGALFDAFFTEDAVIDWVRQSTTSNRE
ncbi:homocitrate synthase [Actinomadura macra]|uniref:homocitrate synthase n=1 Tax=Actinomadura macra TaxID=46164 RepID=UPI0008328AEE|nr:homocitrate synthase [Actinomadura macra]